MKIRLKDSYDGPIPKGSMEKVILDKEEVESIAYEFNLLVQRNNQED